MTAKIWRIIEGPVLLNLPGGKKAKSCCARLLRPQSRPFKERVECGAHRLSPLGQIVFNLRRHLRVHSAVDDAVALELAELLDQHLLRHARNR